jgi:hypothetical protein
MLATDDDDDDDSTQSTASILQTETNILTNTTTDVEIPMQFKLHLLRIQAGSACNG